MVFHSRTMVHWSCQKLLLRQTAMVTTLSLWHWSPGENRSETTALKSRFQRSFPRVHFWVILRSSLRMVKPTNFHIRFRVELCSESLETYSCTPTFPNSRFFTCKITQPGSSHCHTGQMGRWVICLLESLAQVSTQLTAGSHFLLFSLLRLSLWLLLGESLYLWQTNWL